MKPFWWVVLGVAAVLIVGGGAVVVMNTRGYRNKNPGNLKWDGRTQWRGMVTQDPPGPGGFLVFESMEYGFRALFRDLRKDMEIDGQRTVRQLITEFAPGSENNTAAYIDHVARQLQVGPDDVLESDRIPDLMLAIARHENGFIYPGAENDLQAGIRLA